MTVKIERAKPVAKKLKVLLYGPSGSGKTLAALGFPRVLMIDAESGSDLYAGRNGVPEFDRARIKTVSELMEVIRMVEADNGKTWDTLVIDPVSVFYQVEKNVASSNNTKDIDMRGWNKINGRMGGLYNLLTGLNTHVVIIAREAVEYSGEGLNLKKIGVKPDADKNLVYNMDFVLRLNADHSAVVEKSRGVVLGKDGHLATVSWADFEPVSKLYIQGEKQDYMDEEQAADLEADSLSNPDVAKEFWAVWTGVKNGLTGSDIMAALGGISKLSEWTEGRAKADEAVKAYVDDVTTAKPATPKAEAAIASQQQSPA